MPLLVLTADRPPELREIGAGQTIDQVKLYGARPSGSSRSTTSRPRRSACAGCASSPAARYWTALEGRPGPVHLNFSLREPLVLDAPLPAEEPGGGGRDGGRPWVTRPRTQPVAAPALLDGLRAALDAHPRAVIVAGRSERDPGLGEALAGLADRSPCRCSPSRCRAPAAVRPRSPTTTRCCATRLRRRPRARPRPALRRPPDLQAAAPVAARPRRRSRSPSMPSPPGRTRPAPSARSSPPTRALLAPKKPRKDRGWLDSGATRTAPPRRDLATLGDLSEPRIAPSSACGSARRDARGRLLDAGARRRDVLPRPRGAAAGAGQPRRQRDRRDGLDRVRRRGRRAGRRCC